MAGRVSRRMMLMGTAATGLLAALGASWLALGGGGRPSDGTPPPNTPGTSGVTPTPGSSPRATTVAVVAGDPDGYLAVAPRVLRAGQTEAVAVTLFKGESPAAGAVSLTLSKDGQPVASASGQITGHGSLDLALPRLGEGDYRLDFKSQTLQGQATVRVEDGTLVFVETDKPIYKPGQTLHIRVMALDPTLRPASGEATVEVMDAKGIKVFKKLVPVDDFGLAAVDLPLSTEPNLGVWKVRAALGRRASQVDVRIERYVLPKYEVSLNLAKEWALASEKIGGTVGAEYSFGKPVKGEVIISASRFVGTWQEYAKVTRPLDGKTTFELPAVQYAAGTPGAAGLSNVRLDVTVREQSTGYEEKTNRLVTIAASPVTVRLVAESATFKPGLPLTLLAIAETPDKKPVDTETTLQISFVDEQFQQLQQSNQRVAIRNGAALVTLNPPARSAMLNIMPTNANRSSVMGPAIALRAGYSPSGTFIQVQPVGVGAAGLKVGDTAQFKVNTTREAKTLYYEVVARGKVVFSDMVSGPEIRFTLTPLMAPEARLLVYQLLPTSEVAADYVPFKVQGSYPQSLKVDFERPEARPGDKLAVTVQAEGPARVGLAAVDRSVFILAENRLNLQQVFGELERLYQKPQIELHEVGGPVGGRGAMVDVAAPAIKVAGPAAEEGGVAAPRPVPAVNTSPPATVGAKEIFQSTGVVVLTNRQVPEGKALAARQRAMADGAVAAGAPAPLAEAARPASAPAEAKAANSGAELAEVQRVRQFFPETWLWQQLTTDSSGRASQMVEAPDSITTWMVRAVALSKDKGLGIGETQLKVFQPFFVQIDLPYSVVRGEELPARVALYNYQTTPQEFTVELETGDWFTGLGSASQTVSVAPNNVGAAAFMIRPTGLGVRQLKVVARSRGAADAIIKEVIVEPEGVQRELVDNVTLAANSRRTLDLTIPPGAVAGSGRAYLAVTGNILSQTMEGLEKLLQMPFGCGEQNMILFAPNVFVARYLKETRQAKPEVMAKAELLMLTGYQRQMTYRRSDASFSAFGQSDKDGSLWLTAFVLKTFAQAKDLIFVDEAVLGSAREWLRRLQRPDGSFDPVGFVHHKELMGGQNGKLALTGFTTIALKEAGEVDAVNRALRYIEGQLDQTNDPYSLALSAYALALGKSGRAAAAQEKLMKLARENDEGLSWGGGDEPRPADQGQAKPGGPAREIGIVPPDGRRSAAIETTGYAALALLQQGDRVNAMRALRWLAARRNAYGGYGSTQDTIVALQAMTTAATLSRDDVAATVRLSAGQWRKEVAVTPENADILQVIEVPTEATVEIDVQGKGQLQAQAVRRFNLPAAQAAAESIFKMEVRYNTDKVEVNDLITISASVRYTPPQPVTAGMVVFDVAVPTGFAAVTESLTDLPQQQPKLKRWDVAGRKVIFYIEDMQPNDQVVLTFQARALYPVKAQPVTSQAYAYYRPEWKGEHLGQAVTVGGRP